MSLPVAFWALAPYSDSIQKTPGQNYILHFELINIIRFFSCFYALYFLPGLLLFFWAGRRWSYNPFMTPVRFLLAFAWGMVAHVLAIFIQKYLNLPYSPWVLLLCLAGSYIFLALLFRPLKSLLIEERPERKWDYLTWGVLLLTLGLGLEMTLRARASSVSLMGDAYGHLILLLGTLNDGPLPNSTPFFSTFVMNLYPMSFHALLANLYTLIPNIEHIDLLRYFSVLMVPCFVFIFFAFFTFLSQSRPIGAITTLAVFSVSGGGWTLRIPILYYPWYWSIAWCMTAAVFYILLKDDLKSKLVHFWTGVLLGAGVLMHPMMAPRMGAILLVFFLLEIIRRMVIREPIRPLVHCGLSFILGAAATLSIWVVPMLLQFGWEETYSYEYIVENFEKIYPKGVQYIQKLKEWKFGFKDLIPWIWQNAGLFPSVLSPLGLVALGNRYRYPASSLMLAWPLAMVLAVLLPYLPNPYRYFEYLFLGLVALTAYGLGWLYYRVSSRWHSLILLIYLVVALVGVHQDFWPKYRLALHYYGRTQWTDNLYSPSRHLVSKYQKSKAEGNLDRDFGGFRGLLWPRQKKVWDIHLWRIQNQKKN